MTAKGEPAWKPEPTFLGWSWRAHLDDLHRLVTEERWLEAAKRLSALLVHALDQATKAQGRP